MKYNGLLPPDESLNRTHITMHVVLDYIDLGKHSLGVYDDERLVLTLSRQETYQCVV